MKKPVKRGRGRPRKYRWDELLRLPRFVLRAGVDYDCGPGSIMQQLRNAASVQGVHLESVTAEANGDISVQVAKEQPCRR